MEGLDALVRSIESGTFTSKSKTYNRKGDQAFNPKRAREVREKHGLTQKQLAKELSFDNKFSLSTQINKYETGKVKPSYPPRGEITKQYLTWLKEHDYNPFDL
jgi:DNA-binding XRE family transcriptional regulator